MDNDTTTTEMVKELLQQLTTRTLETSPTSGNGYGLALTVFALVAVGLGVLYWTDKKIQRKREDDRHEQDRIDKLEKEKLERDDRLRTEDKRDQQAGEIKSAIEEHARQSSQQHELHRDKVAALDSQLAVLTQRVVAVEKKVFKE